MIDADPIPDGDLGQTVWAKKHGLICPNCDDWRQLWVTDGKWICHRVGCYLEAKTREGFEAGDIGQL